MFSEDLFSVTYVKNMNCFCRKIAQHHGAVCPLFCTKEMSGCANFERSSELNKKSVKEVTAKGWLGTNK